MWNINVKQPDNHDNIDYSFLHKRSDEDEADSRQFQDGHLHHERVEYHQYVHQHGNRLLFRYLVVVHDLDLNTMSEDLAGFKPNMYRLMQISGKAIEMAINYTSLFHAKRNRVEIISDFPEGNDAEVLSPHSQ